MPPTNQTAPTIYVADELEDAFQAFVKRRDSQQRKPTAKPRVKPRLRKAPRLTRAERKTQLAKKCRAAGVRSAAGLFALKTK